jgi:hypothetical protein
MFRLLLRVALLAVTICCVAYPVSGQSVVRPGERINGYTEVVFDTRGRSYDYLVDGSLAKDEPARKAFRTVEAAYDAAPAGTPERPTVIGIKPDVYLLPGKGTESGLTITKPNITLLGLTNDRRNVVLADNRGNQQGAGVLGASNNGFTMIVRADGFTAMNLTILNYCNVDYEYPGNPARSLRRRSDVITQAVALQSSGDRHVYSHVALVSRLDTWFLSTTRAYLSHVYVEGTEDFIGGGQISVWEDSEVRTFSPRGILFTRGAVFVRTVFKAVSGMEFYKVVGEPIALIDCTLPEPTPGARVAWMGWKVPLRENSYSLTHKIRDARGRRIVLPDGLSDPPTFTLSREITDREVRAFTPWNLLRETPDGQDDGWDPARGSGSAALPIEDQVFRMALVNGNPTVRTGGAGAVVEARIAPVRARAVPITWKASSPLVRVSSTTGDRVTVTGSSTADHAEWVDVTASAPNGFFATAHVYVEPAFKATPAFSRRPLVSVAGGRAVVDYALDTERYTDESDVTWYLCGDTACAARRQVAVSRGGQPAKRVSILPGFAGKLLAAGVRPKHDISEAGAEVIAVSPRAIAAPDAVGTAIVLDPRTFVETPTPEVADGTWMVRGDWKVATDERLVGGYGIHGTSADAAVVYVRDAPVERVSIRLVVTPDKNGQSFAVPGSPEERHATLNGDVYIKYDPRTKSGYSLRAWRTTQSAVKVMFQFYKHVSGVSTPLGPQQVLTGVWKPNCTLTLSIEGSVMTAEARNDVDGEVLSMRETIAPNAYGGAGVRWPGSTGVNSRNVFSVIEVTYPGEVRR